MAPPNDSRGRIGSPTRPRQSLSLDRARCPAPRHRFYPRLLGAHQRPRAVGVAEGAAFGRFLVAPRELEIEHGDLGELLEIDRILAGLAAHLLGLLGFPRHLLEIPPQ